MKLLAKVVIRRNTGLAESDGACSVGLSTDFREEMNRVANFKDALNSGSPQLGI